MPGRLEFDLSLSRGSDGRIPNAERDVGRNRAARTGPMRLLVMGDFSGLPAAQKPPLASRPTHRVDLDALDAVMQRLAPRLALPAGDLALAALDDFHPDALVRSLPAFGALRDIRQRLLDPAQFAHAAAQLRQDSAAVAAPVAALGTMPPTPLAPPAPPTVPDQARDAPADDADLLAQLLGGKPAGLAARAPAVAAATGIDAFIRSVVAPHTVPDIAPQQATYLASVDMAMAQALRAVLHAPAFQALESAWRGVQWLISSLELDEDLQLHLFDVSRDELLADVVAARGQIDQTGAYAALVDRWRNQPGAAGWTALVGLYSFGPSQADIGLLAALGLLASEVGGPFLAAGSLDLAGGGTAAAGADLPGAEVSDAEVPGAEVSGEDLPGAGQAPALAGWQALRRSEVAPFIGLAAPRVLLRLPYGKAADPIEAFKFDELPTTPDPEQFLWGNGALACALLIGRAFSAKGWGFEPGDQREITDLPAYTVLRDGERELQACAEHYLGEQGGQALLAAGLMPVLSHRHANAVTVLRFQSVALPAATLAGLSVSR